MLSHLGKLCLVAIDRHPVICESQVVKVEEVEDQAFEGVVQVDRGAEEGPAIG